MSACVNPMLEKIYAALPLQRDPWRAPFGGAGFPEAAVLTAITNESDPRVLLGRRALHLSNHPGEVAFAGGKREPEDSAPWDTALREAEEEVGIAPHQVRPLGELPPLMTRTGFQVHACVGSIEANPELIVDAAEFDSVFMAPLATFADSRIFRLEKMFDGERHRMVPHYQVEDDNVWGVTAAILAMLANVAYDAGLDLQRDWKEKP